MKKLKKYKIVIIIFTLALLIFGGMWLSRLGDAGGKVVKVEKGRFHISVHAVGNLRSADSKYIGCPHIPQFWEYTISFMAPEGKQVKKGEKVLGFDTRKLMERLTLRQSELDTAAKEMEKIRLVEQEKLDSLKLQWSEVKVRLKKARQKAGQPEDLQALNESRKQKMDLDLAQMEEKLVRSRLDNQHKSMRTRILEQENKIRRLQTRVNTLKESITKLSVKVVKPGIVVYSANWRGRKNAVGDQVWLGSKIIEMPDLSRMQVAAVIPEPEAGKVREGMDVEIRLDANPDRVYKGKIKELGRIFRTRSYDQPAMVFDAIIDIAEPDTEQMRPGMAAKVDIIISSRDNVVYVPEKAVIYLEKGRFVRKKSFMGKSMVPVVTGTHSAGKVEILEGLEPGDKIIVPDQPNGGNQ